MFLHILRIIVPSWGGQGVRDTDRVLGMIRVQWSVWTICNQKMYGLHDLNHQVIEIT